MRPTSRLFPFFLLVSITVPLSSFARDREVSAAGTCTRIATPDRGQITLTAEAQDRDLQAAARRASELHERASQAIKKLGLENLELRTVEYSLNEVREWEKNRTVSKGFKSRLGLRVSTSSIQKLGEVIAIAAREELRDVTGLATYLSPEKLRKEQFACLQEASEDARAKAQKLAESLGARLGDVMSINESHSGGSEPPPMMALRAEVRAKSDMMAPPQVEAGQQEIRVDVNAVFGLK